MISSDPQHALITTANSGAARRRGESVGADALETRERLGAETLRSSWREAFQRPAAYATAAGSAEAALQRACPAGERRICGRRATAPSTSPEALLRAAGMVETLRSAWREALLREALLRAAAYATAAGSSSRWPASSAEAALQRICPAGERRF
jgi:hypothetical protein